MKNKSKGFIVPLLILIIAVLAIGGGIYIYQQNQNQTNTQSTVAGTSSSTDAVQTTANTSKTYASTQYGFAVNIPNDFQVDTYNSSLIFRSPQTEQDFKQSISGCVKSDHQGACGEVSNENIFDLTFATVPTITNPKVCVPNDCSQKDDFVSNGITWTVLYYPSYGSGKPAYEYYTLKDNKYYTFTIYASNDQVAREILTSFKFTN